MKILTFLANTENFILQLHVATDLLALPLPKKKNVVAARTPYFGKQEKKYETVEDFLLDFFLVQLSPSCSRSSWTLGRHF
jgi:hypothetical protein